MAKDKTLLTGISVLFTEETLEDILRKVTRENEVKILSWDFGEASKKGDSYMSVLNRVKVNGEAAGKPIQISLVVKSLLKNLGARKTLRCTDFFYNEITCYTEVFPKFQEFLKSKGKDDLMVIPRCLAAVTDGENDFIALEDVSVLGFGPVTRQNTLELPECSLILKVLAKFHAVSFAYKDQNKAEFQRLAEKLSETFFTPQLYNWYRTYQTLVLRVCKDALAKECPGSKYEKHFNSLSGEELYHKCVEFCDRIESTTSVITHGDAWPPNFLICKSDEENQGALVLDFQIARCGSPVLDTSLFIYTCTEKSLRDNHYDDLLKLYHDELSRSIRSLGSDPTKLYPWDVFVKEVRELSLFGINFSFEAVQFSMLPSSEAFDMDTLGENEVVEMSKLWNFKPIKSKEGRRRLADVICEGIERNYL